MPNPNLGPERATNYELGWKGRIAPDLRGSAAIFYSDVRDLIQAVRVSPTQSQTQNINKGDFYGFEMSMEAQLLPQLALGGNYTFIQRMSVTFPFPGSSRPACRPTRRSSMSRGSRSSD